MIRRDGLPKVKAAPENAGYVHGQSLGIDFFLDSPNAKPRDAIHLWFAKEAVKPKDVAANPDVTDSDHTGEFPIVNLEALVKMKLTSYRLKDRVHWLDMIDIELIDNTWPARFDSELGQRLQQLLDNPDG